MVSQIAGFFLYRSTALPCSLTTSLSPISPKIPTPKNRARQ